MLCKKCNGCLNDIFKCQNCGFDNSCFNEIFFNNKELISKLMVNNLSQEDISNRDVDYNKLFFDCRFINYYSEYNNQSRNQLFIYRVVDNKYLFSSERISCAKAISIGDESPEKNKIIIDSWFVIFHNEYKEEDITKSYIYKNIDSTDPFVCTEFNSAHEKTKAFAANLNRGETNNNEKYPSNVGKASDFGKIREFDNDKKQIVLRDSNDDLEHKNKKIVNNRKISYYIKCYSSLAILVLIAFVVLYIGVDSYLASHNKIKSTEIVNNTQIIHSISDSPSVNFYDEVCNKNSAIIVNEYSLIQTPLVIDYLHPICYFNHCNIVYDDLSESILGFKRLACNDSLNELFLLSCSCCFYL